MDRQNLLPHQTQPIQRTTVGQLPTELAELSEETLGGVTPASRVCPPCLCQCSYDNDVAESGDRY